MHRLLERQLKRYFGAEFRFPEEWGAFLGAISDCYGDFDLHREVLERSLVLSSRELHQANAEMRAVFQAIPDLLFRLDHQGKILDCKAGTNDDLLLQREKLFGKRIQDIPIKRVADQFINAIRDVLARKSLVTIEYSLSLRGSESSYEARLVPLARDQLVVIVQNINERKRSEEKLKDAHQQLVETSRMAGKAEVATSVLHNVGNVLNSVNILHSVINDKIQKSKVTNLAKVPALLQQHADDLPGFLTKDPKGKQLQEYLSVVAQHLIQERGELLKDLAQLGKNIEHIKEIVVRQQSYARVSGLKELIFVSDLVDDALRINAASVERHRIRIVREYDEVAAVLVDKHKVLQILVNLLNNAKQAVDQKQYPDNQEKQITLRIESAGGHKIKVSVADNGVGIPEENLVRIFQHGFTTRTEGHGFGLHSGALAARELGGALRAESDGPGKGATFTLELPAHQNAKAPASH